MQLSYKNCICKTVFSNIKSSRYFGFWKIPNTFFYLFTGKMCICCNDFLLSFHKIFYEHYKNKWEIARKTYEIRCVPTSKKLKNT